MLTITAGLAIRRELRRALISQGYEFKEEKGWVDSQFTVADTQPRIEALRSAASSWKKSLE